jgi:hypothetical protein
MMKTKLIKFLWTAGGFTASVAPLIVVLVIRWDSYIKTWTDGVRLSIGGIILAVMMIAKLRGALKIPSGTTVAVCVLILSILLSRVLDDLTLLCTAYIIGDVLNLLFFKKKIDSINENTRLNREADVIVEKTKKILDEYIGNGRT